MRNADAIINSCAINHEHPKFNTLNSMFARSVGCVCVCFGAGLPLQL